MSTETVTKKKRNGTICLLISAIIGIAYLLYIISYFAGATTGAASDAEAVGAGLASMIVMPHIVCVGIAAMFNVLAVFMKRTSGFALVAGILYTVAMALFVMYFMFVILEAILCYIGYAKRKRAKKQLS